jgi:mRNA m6A methyltransferase catalytic subunit
MKISKLDLKFFRDPESHPVSLSDTQTEKCLVNILANKHLILPTNSTQIIQQLTYVMEAPPDQIKIHHLLQQIAQQDIIDMKCVSINNESGFEIIHISHEKLHQHFQDILSEAKKSDDDEFLDNVSSRPEIAAPEKKKLKVSDTSDIMSLLSLPSAKEKQHKQVGEEILELLSKPTAKELQLTEKFRSQGGTVMEFCPYLDSAECLKAQDNPGESKCNKLHFKKIIQAHTDVVLGDCSFLNTCFHMSTCKYVHYQVDNEQTMAKPKSEESLELPKPSGLSLIAPQWIQCDLRYLDMSCLGKFSVIMADPPWGE